MTRKEWEEYTDAAITGRIRDDENPIFILDFCSDKNLVKIASGELDMVSMAKFEINNRS